MKYKSLVKKLEEIENAYNNSYHKAIGMTPIEAWTNPNREDLAERNAKGYFKKIRKEEARKHNIDDKVMFMKLYKLKNEKDKGRFVHTGKIVKILPHKEYIVENEETKKRIKLAEYFIKSIPRNVF